MIALQMRLGPGYCTSDNGDDDTGAPMLHPRKIAVLARRLAGQAPSAAGRRRRELLGTVLERKAASGAFDLELLHYWLDMELTRRRDRALFGLGRPGIRSPRPLDPRIR